MPRHQPAQNFNRNSDENTMNSCAARSAHGSLERIKARHTNIDFETTLQDLCIYIADKISAEQANGQVHFTNKYKVAQRALWPGNGGVASDGRGHVLESLLYYWKAADDDHPDIDNNNIDEKAEIVNLRKEALIEGMREIQRGNNNNTNQAQFTEQQNPSRHDSMICPYGAFNKFPEKYVGLHPDVKLVIELQTYIKQLLQAFTAKLYRDNSNNGVPTFDDFVENHITEAQKQELKTKVIVATGGAYSHNNQRGLMNASRFDRDYNYLTNSIDNIEYLTLEYITIDRNDRETTHSYTEEQLDALIKESEEKYQQESQRVNANNGIALPPAYNAPAFDFDALKEFLRANVPEPNQRYAGALWGGGNLWRQLNNPGNNPNAMDQYLRIRDQFFRDQEQLEAEAAEKREQRVSRWNL